MAKAFIWRYIYIRIEPSMQSPLRSSICTRLFSLHELMMLKAKSIKNICRYRSCLKGGLFSTFVDMETTVFHLKQVFHIQGLFQVCQDRCSSHSHRFVPIFVSLRFHSLSISRVRLFSVPPVQAVFGAGDNTNDEKTQKIASQRLCIFR